MKFLRAIISLLRFDRTNWTALALCVFAAIIFWTFNALNKEYASNLSVPLRIEFDEDQFAAAKEIPVKLTVNVSGNGWDLLRASLNQKSSVITIPIERPTEVHRIPGAILAPQVVSQLGPLKLNFVVSDTLRLSIEQKTTRHLKLVADISKVNFRANMGQISPALVLPDSIRLEGPSSYLTALPDSLNIEVPRRLITAHYRETLEVRMEHSEFIKRDPPVVEIFFEVGLVRNVSLRLPLIEPNKVFGMATDQDSITCIFQIPHRDQARFKTDSTALTAILPVVRIQKGDSIRVAPLLGGLPSYAKIVHVDSVTLQRKL